MGEVIRINFGSEINAEGWLYNRSSKLWFLSAKTLDVPKNFQATLVVNPSLERTDAHCEIRLLKYGYKTKPLTGISLGTTYTRGEYNGSADIEYNPSTDEYQIDAGEWKDKKNGTEFLCNQDIMVAAVSKVNYHKNKFLTAPQVSKDVLNRLFEKTEELEAQIIRAEKTRTPLFNLAGKYPQLFPYF